MARMVTVIAAALLWLAAGCASEREQNLKRYNAMHQDVRKAPSEPPKKWEMNPGSPP